MHFSGSGQSSFTWPSLRHLRHTSVVALLWLWTVVLHMAFLTASAAYFRLWAVSGHVTLLPAIPALVVTTSSTSSCGTLSCEVSFLSTLSTSFIGHISFSFTFLTFWI